MSRLFSQRLALRDTGDGPAVCCRGCGHAIAPAAGSWKSGATLRERRLCEVDPIYTTSSALMLREFVCPGCAALLDSEIALPEDPFLEDAVRP